MPPFFLSMGYVAKAVCGLVGSDRSEARFW
jgi:hypothetical protein